MRVARFRVYERLDLASAAQEGTVVIDRGPAPIFTVRPKRRRKVYALPLSFVARMVCRHVIAIELAEKRKAKAARRRGR